MQVSDIKNKLFHPVQSNDCTQLQTRPCVIQNLSMSMKCFFKQLQVSSVEKGWTSDMSGKIMHQQVRGGDEEVTCG